jgi:hypothetical protein
MARIKDPRNSPARRDPGRDFEKKKDMITTEVYQEEEIEIADRDLSKEIATTNYVRKEAEKEDGNSMKIPNDKAEFASTFLIAEEENEDEPDEEEGEEEEE